MLPLEAWRAASSPCPGKPLPNADPHRLTIPLSRWNPYRSRACLKRALAACRPGARPGQSFRPRSAIACRVSSMWQEPRGRRVGDLPDAPQWTQAPSRSWSATAPALLGSTGMQRPARRVSSREPDTVRPSSLSQQIGSSLPLAWHRRVAAGGVTPCVARGGSRRAPPVGVMAHNGFRDRDALRRFSAL